MKKVIVFGCSGFVGSALVEYLHKNGYSVHGCDVVKVDPNNFLDQFYLSIGASDSLDPVFKNKFDICINCAGSASVPYSFQDPFKDYELNTRIVFSILTAIKNENPSCRFINLSSAAVYGNPVKLPIAENSLIKPISPYGNHKFMSELICNQFHDYFNIQTCSLRIFSAYGPGLKKQLFWDMYQKSLSGNDISLFGTGKETRDFIFIDDLVRAIELIAKEVKYGYRAINIANGHEVTIKESAEIFYKNLNPKVNIKFTGEIKSGDPQNWEADISILKTFGYQARFTINAGIEEYVNWLKCSC